jgi:hypothetical protein
MYPSDFQFEPRIIGEQFSDRVVVVGWNVAMILTNEVAPTWKLVSYIKIVETLFTVLFCDILK